MEGKKGLFDKKEDDDPFFVQHEYAEKMKSRIPGSWMVHAVWVIRNGVKIN